MTDDAIYLEYWNKLYNTENFFGTGSTKLAIFAESFLNKLSKAKILEVGCGQGRDSIYFSQLGHDVDAFDISENAIKFLFKVKKELELKNLNVFVHNSLEPLDYPEKYFDFVYSNLALQFFNLIELSKIFDNISKVMKNNSMFLFSTKKIGDKYYRKGEKITDFTFSYNGITRYFYSIEELKEIFTKRFDVISIESDRHENLDSTVSVWWKILLSKKSN